MSVEYIIYVHSNCNYIILCTIDNRVGEPTGVIYAGGGCSRKLLGRCSAHCRGEPEQAQDGTDVMSCSSYECSGLHSKRYCSSLAAHTARKQVVHYIL